MRKVIITVEGNIGEVFKIVFPAGTRMDSIEIRNKSTGRIMLDTTGKPVSLGGEREIALGKFPGVVMVNPIAG